MESGDDVEHVDLDARNEKKLGEHISMCLARGGVYDPDSWESLLLSVPLLKQKHLPLIKKYTFAVATCGNPKAL